MVGSSPCPDVAKSSASGDKVKVSGSGSFNFESGKATGSGSFLHTTSGGALIAFGTWTVVEFIGFIPGGFSTGGGVLPAGSEGGVAAIKVHLSPATGGSGFDAILTVYCGLATPGVTEGITLFVIGGPNFNIKVSGVTLFIQQ